MLLPVTHYAPQSPNPLLFPRPHPFPAASGEGCDDAPATIAAAAERLPVPLAAEVFRRGVAHGLSPQLGLNALREGSAVLVPEHRLLSWCAVELPSTPLSEVRTF